MRRAAFVTLRCAFWLRAWHRDARRNMSDPRLHGRFVHVLRQAPQDGRVCVWHDSVPKVEYMTRPTCGTVEDIARRGLRPLPRPEQDGRIQVPLHATIVADDVSGLMMRAQVVRFGGVVAARRTPVEVVALPQPINTEQRTRHASAAHRAITAGAYMQDSPVLKRYAMGFLA